MILILLSEIINTQKDDMIIVRGRKLSSWKDLIIHGDCIDAVDEVDRKVGNSIKLVYIDPPFFSNVDYSIKTKSKSSSEEASKVKDRHSYSDRWDGGLAEYLSFMKVRLERIGALLARNGCLWVHLDYHVSHYVKTILDEIFGYSNFVNEIIWKRTNSPKSQSRGFGSQHDVILLYAKDATHFEMNPIYRPHDKRSFKPYSYKDEKGRFRLIEIEAQGIQKTQDRRVFEWKGRTAPYLYNIDRLDEWWEKGLIYRSRNGRYTKKQYLADVQGLPVSDLWLDIPPVQGSSHEFTGFITQKPIALLQRVIQSASKEGDTVADFFSGSGTLAVAASEMNRRWIISDESEAAIELTKKRLQKIDHDSYELIRLEK